MWLDEIEVMVARDQSSSSNGFFVSAKGGHNDESHNHNDIGSFVVYTNGCPVIVDAGVESYTAKTFSAQRYDIWTMQSGYHSLLPTFDGVMQAPGSTYNAENVVYHVDEASAQLRLDIAPAYPAKANVETWLRTLTLIRGQEIIIEDAFVLTKAVGKIQFSLLTPCTIDLSQAEHIQLLPATIDADRQSGTAKLMYDTATLTLSTEIIPITDPRLKDAWSQGLNRMLFTMLTPPLTGRLVWKTSLG